MTTSGPTAGEAAQKLRGAAHDARRIAGDFQEGANELGAAFRAQIDSSPYQTVLLAAGIGYVLGGGLASPLTRSLSRLALRMLILPALREPIGNVWNSVVANMSAPVQGVTGTAPISGGTTTKA